PPEPHRPFPQSARARLPRPHAPDLLRRDGARLLQNADVLLHARERHVERLGKVRDRSVGSSELLQNATPRGVRERGERSIKSGRHILNHMVQYITPALQHGKGWPRASCPRSAAHRWRGTRASVALRSWTLLRRRRAMTGSRGLSARFG